MRYFYLSLRGISFLVCSLLVGCTGTGTADPPAASDVTLSSLAQDLPWPAAQVSSILTESLLNGVSVYAKSAGAVEQGTALELGSEAEAFEWAIYRFDPGADALDSVAVLLDIAEDSQAWIGLADYMQGCWCFHGPYCKSKTLAVDDACFHSAAGELFVCVVVCAGDSATVQSLSVRTIRTDNEAPWAELTADVTSGDVPLAVQFDASGSVDPDGEIRYYLWDFDGDGGFERTTFTATTAFTYIEPGDYTVTVAVVDDCGEWGLDTLLMDTWEAGNTPPQPSLTATPASGDAPLTVELDASGSYDPDGAIVKYEWDFDGDDIIDGYSAYEPTATHTYTVPGDFPAIVIITDDAGQVNTGGVTVEVNIAGNAEPAADVTATPASGDIPLAVAFDASGSSDADGSIVRYDWDFDGDGNFELYDGGAAPSWTYTSAGDYNAAVRVSDDDGAQDSGAVTVEVNVPGNAEPVADLAGDKTESYAPFTITFDASGSTDSDGTLELYEWDFDGDGNYEEYGTTDSAVYTYPAYGNYLASVRVTDDEGAQDMDELQLTLPSAWWMFGMEPTHNRRSPFVGTQTNNVKWSYTTADDVKSSAAIAADGTIYVGSFDNDLYALNPDGSFKWSYTTGGYIISSPAIGADGTVYIGCGDNSVYALYPNGSLKWTYATGNVVNSSPTIGSDGTIYVGSDDGKLYALYPDGNLKWIYTTGSYVFCSPAIGADGTIYIGSADSKLHALKPDGTIKWSYTTGSYTSSSPAIGADGTIYIGSLDNKLYAINPNGSFKWSYTTSGNLLSSPAIGVDGTVYVGSMDNNFYAINPNGSLKWSYPTGNLVQSSPAIGADGTIYIGSWDCKVHAVNPDGSLKWSYTTSGPVFSSPAIGVDGKVYVGSSDNKLYAFGPP